MARRIRPGLLLEALALAAAAPLLMYLPLPTLQRAVERFARLRRTRHRPEVLARHVDLAIRLGRLIVRGRCLSRGVALYWLMRRCGEDVELRFGLRRGDDGRSAEGHCWISRAGEPQFEQRDPGAVFATTVVMSANGVRSAAPVLC